MQVMEQDVDEYQRMHINLDDEIGDHQQVIQ
jgi:hypothetical protein